MKREFSAKKSNKHTLKPCLFGLFLWSVFVGLQLRTVHHASGDHQGDLLKPPLFTVGLIPLKWWISLQLKLCYYDDSAFIGGNKTSRESFQNHWEQWILVGFPDEQVQVCALLTKFFWIQPLLWRIGTSPVWCFWKISLPCRKCSVSEGQHGEKIWTTRNSISYSKIGDTFGTPRLSLAPRSCLGICKVNYLFPKIYPRPPNKSSFSFDAVFWQAWRKIVGKVLA